MINLRTIADRFETEAPRGEVTEAVMMRDYDRAASLCTEECGWRTRSAIERPQGLWG